MRYILWGLFITLVLASVGAAVVGVWMLSGRDEAPFRYQNFIDRPPKPTETLAPSGAVQPRLHTIEPTATAEPTPSASAIALNELSSLAEPSTQGN